MEPMVSDRGEAKSRVAYSTSAVNSFPGKDSRLGLAVLHALLEQLPVGVVVANGKGRIVIIYENELAQRVRTSDSATAEWPIARALLLGEVVRDEETDIVMSDGTRRWFRVSATPIRSVPDCIDGAVVTFADVTAVKQAAAWKPAIESLRRL
jgi:PAS domain-containing protein